VFPVDKESDTTRPDCALVMEPAAAVAVRTVGIIAPARSVSSRTDNGEARVDFFRILALRSTIHEAGMWRGRE